MPQLTLSFLGGFEARLDEQPLGNFRSAKVQGLLVYLALTHEQAHAREVLATLFWPEEPEHAANHNLRQSIYRLRQLLGEPTGREEPLRQAQGRPYLLVTRTTVQFNAASNTALDVIAFLAHLESNQLEQAVALYRGDLLAGFTCDSLPFDEWLRQEREQLHRLALDALFAVTAHHLTRGDYQEAQHLARQQLALEPWREEAHRQLMQALALSGDRSAALAHYAACRRVLLEELGSEPAAETQALVARIRDQPLAPQAQRKAEFPHQLVIPFVGRQPEFETLVNAYRQASDNTLQVVALVGSAGIGKTRLAQQFLGWAATQGADVLSGRTFTTSAGLSYQPITHLLRLRLERENAPEDLLSDLWLAQLTRLLPELRERYPDLPEPTQDENTAREHLFEAITRLLQALAARKPLVVLIDDWHWADTASLDLLYYAAVRCSEAKLPMLIVLTLRQEAIGESPELQSWLTKLQHATETLSLPVRELSRGDAAQLIQMLLEPETDRSETVLTQFTEWLFAETEGQPLFLTETLKALVDDGLVQPSATAAPAAGARQGAGRGAWHIDWLKFSEQGVNSRILHGVQEIIQGWLARIPPQAKELLTAAAVLAQQATFDHLCHVAGLAEMEAIEALDELLGKQLLQEADGALTLPHHDPVYSFSHQKVSEVVYAEAGAARRRRLHRRAFETLQRSAPAAADLAHHALKAGLLAETIHYSLIAGNEAMAIFAVRVAIPHYETAWQLAEQKGWPAKISGADRQGLYVGLGRAYELVEKWPQAKEIYQAMITIAQSMGAPAMECLGLNHLATVYINGMFDRDRAIALLTQAQTVAEQNGDQRGLAETELSLARAAAFGGDANDGLRHGEQALTIARELGHLQLLARCLSTLAMINLQLRQWDMVEVYATEARQHYAAAGNQVLAADSQRMISFSQTFSGRPRESLATLQKAYAFYQQIENLWGEAECARLLAHTQLELGDYGQSIRWARQGVKQARQMSLQMAMVDLALSAWATVQRTMMAFGCAQETLQEVLMESSKRELIGFVKDWVLAESCAIHAFAGEWDQAYDDAKQRLQTREDKSLLSMGLTGWCETEALLRGGEADLARAEVEQLGQIVGNNRRYRLILLRSQAVLAQWDGDWDQAKTHLQAALALAQEIGLPGEEWPILGALGGLYAAQGEPAKAQQAYKASATIILQLAETIEEDGLREGFLSAVPVHSVLERSKATE